MAFAIFVIQGCVVWTGWRVLDDDDVVPNFPGPGLNYTARPKLGSKPSNYLAKPGDSNKQSLKLGSSA